MRSNIRVIALAVAFGGELRRIPLVTTGGAVEVYGVRTRLVAGEALEHLEVLEANYPYVAGEFRMPWHDDYFTPLWRGELIGGLVLARSDWPGVGVVPI